MGKKEQLNLYFNFVAVFLGTFTTLAFYFFVKGLEYQNRFEVITGGTMLVVSMVALYTYGNVAKKSR
jgi:high-affinity Fe2+/Pb2+ permease